MPQTVDGKEAMQACYKCQHRRTVAGSCHSKCAADIREPSQQPQFDKQGIDNGWAFWPHNFDPTWLNHCEHFTPTE